MYSEYIFLIYETLKKSKNIIIQNFPFKNVLGWKYDEFEWENWLITWGHLVIRASISRNDQHQEHDFFFLPKKIHIFIMPSDETIHMAGPSCETHLVTKGEALPPLNTPQIFKEHHNNCQGEPHPCWYLHLFE
jgi:hypothetical protein